jgi:predicted nucleic acid-binding protein
MILLDTNVLGRMTDSADPQCAAVRRAVHVLLGRREQVIVVPQTLYEFWAVATRRPGPPPSGRNGLGMTPEQAGQWLRFFQRRFTLLPDREELFTRRHSFVTTLRIKGIRSYDARLVAAMQSYGVTRLLTFNTDDFKAFPITLIDPVALRVCTPIRGRAITREMDSREALSPPPRRGGAPATGNAPGAGEGAPARCLNLRAQAGWAICRPRLGRRFRTPDSGSDLPASRSHKRDIDRGWRGGSSGLRGNGFRGKRGARRDSRTRLAVSREGIPAV